MSIPKQFCCQPSHLPCYLSSHIMNFVYCSIIAIFSFIISIDSINMFYSTLTVNFFQQVSSKWSFNFSQTYVYIKRYKIKRCDISRENTHCGLFQACWLFLTIKKLKKLCLFTFWIGEGQCNKIFPVPCWCLFVPLQGPQRDKLSPEAIKLAQTLRYRCCFGDDTNQD